MPFQIEENTGDLVILRRLALTERYLLNISVLDSGGFKADTLIVASVEDVNDHSPVFSKDVYEFRIPEGELYKIFQDPTYFKMCIVLRNCMIDK
jgi:hypothetical protein